MAAEGDKQPDAHQHTLRISSRFGRPLSKQQTKTVCVISTGLDRCVLFIPALAPVAIWPRVVNPSILQAPLSRQHWSQLGLVGPVSVYCDWVR